MYSLYRHKMQPQYRLVTTEDAPFPREAKAEDWRLVATVYELWSEATEAIKDKGYLLYRVDVTFKEIEKPSAREGKTKAKKN